MFFSSYAAEALRQQELSMPKLHDLGLTAFWCDEFLPGHDYMDQYVTVCSWYAPVMIHPKGASRCLPRCSRYVTELNMNMLRRQEYAL